MTTLTRLDRLQQGWRDCERNALSLPCRLQGCTAMGRGRGSRMVRMQCECFSACCVPPPTQMGTTQSPTHEHAGWHRPRGGCGCAAVHVGCAPGCGSVGRGKCARVRKPTQSVASMVESGVFHRNKTNFSRGVSHGAGSHTALDHSAVPRMHACARRFYYFLYL